jgi:hypothetical protein
MTASALFEIDPGTGTYGAPGVAQDAAASSVINCRVASVSGVNSIEWRIFGTHGGNFPALGYSGNPPKQIATFTLPGGLGQAYGIECKVNGGVSPAGDLKKSAVYVLDAAGNRPFFHGETFEADALHGVIPRLNTNVPITGVSVPTNNTVWVDAVNGSAGGTAGDLNDPFQTIAQGIAAAIALLPTAVNPVAVKVRSGVYTEAPITIPSFVTLIGDGGTNATIITASTTTAALIVCSANSSLDGFQIQGADGAGGIGISHTAAGALAYVKSCIVCDCTTAISAAGAGVQLSLRQVDVTRAAGETLTTAITATAAATISAFDARVIGVAGAMITTAFVADGAGSKIVVSGHREEYATDGFLVKNTGECLITSGLSNNCTNALRFDTTGGTINISSTVVTGTTAWNVLVDGTGATAFLTTSDVLWDDKISFPSGWAGWFGNLLDQNESSFDVAGELRVGRAEAPAESSFGGGDSHTNGMAVKTNTNLTAGVWNDVTTEAASPSGSTFFAFAGTAVDNCLFVGSDTSQAARGLKLLVSSPVVGGVIDCEYWNGAAWVSFEWMTALADSPYTTSAKALFAAAVDYQMRFGPQASAAASTLDGDTKYWIRFRVTSVLTTRPQLEQIKLHTSHFEINREGFDEFFGAARKYRVINVNSNTFVGIGVSSPADQDLFVGTVGAVGLENNSFAQNVDRQAGIGIPVPFELDTSHPGRLRINWQPADAAAGNVVWRAVISSIGAADVLATSSPGSLSETIVSATSAAPGVAGQGVAVEMDLDFSGIVTSDLSVLSIMIQRQGTSGSDTYGASAIIRPGGIQLRGLTWCDGEPLV